MDVQRTGDGLLKEVLLECWFWFLFVLCLLKELCAGYRDSTVLHVTMFPARRPVQLLFDAL